MEMEDIQRFLISKRKSKMTTIKRVLTLCVIYLSVPLAVVLTAAFVDLSAPVFNPLEWSRDGRFLLSIWTIWLIIILVYYEVTRNI